MEVITLRIMGQADGSHPHVQHDLGILIVVGRARRPTLIAPILVPVHAMDRVGLAVEEKALFLADLDRAKAKRLGDRVGSVGALQQGNFRGVKIGILAPVPAVRRGDVQREKHRFRLTRFDGDGLGLGGHDHPFGIGDVGFDLHLDRACFAVGNQGLDFDLRGGTVQRLRGQVDARRGHDRAGKCRPDR